MRVRHRYSVDHSEPLRPPANYPAESSAHLPRVADHPAEQFVPLRAREIIAPNHPQDQTCTQLTRLNNYCRSRASNSLRSLIRRVQPILILLRPMIRRAWRSTIIKSAFLAALPVHHSRNGAIARIPVGAIEFNIAIARQVISNARLVAAIGCDTASTVRRNAAIDCDTDSAVRLNGVIVRQVTGNGRLVAPLAATQPALSVSALPFVTRPPQTPIETRQGLDLVESANGRMHTGGAISSLSAPDSIQVPCGASLSSAEVIANVAERINRWKPSTCQALVDGVRFEGGMLRFVTSPTFWLPLRAVH